MNQGSPQRIVLLLAVSALYVAAPCPAADLTWEQVVEEMRPYDGPSVEGVDTSTLVGKVMCGYQGWFAAEGDEAGRGWHHYSARGRFEPGRCSIDLWPDVSELDDDEKYATEFRHADGRTAYVFSSMNRKTVVRHFSWMQEHGIDGVFVQRFTPRPGDVRQLHHTCRALANCREGANRHGRTYAVMYDMSFDARAIDHMREDWKRLVDRMQITKDPAYLHHRGKPVISLWGLGFTHRRLDVEAARALLDFLKNDPDYGGLTVMLGVPAYWRTLKNDCQDDSAVHELIGMADVVSPWSVGRFAYLDEIPGRAERQYQPDMAWCQERQQDYLPVVFPGFSWHNMYPEFPLGQTPRHKGQFLWQQFTEVQKAGASMVYVAMFDEIDEGTAIFKCTNDPPVGESPFLTYEGLPSDHYLWLTGTGGRLIRGEIEPTEVVPPRDGQAIFPAIRLHAGSVETPLAKLAVDELRDFLGRMFINPVEVVDGGERFSLVVGTPAHPLIERALAEGKLELPKGSNAEQGYTIKTIDGTMYIAAATEQGVLFGIYELLESYGAYFLPNGERLPAKGEFVVKPLDVRRSPVLKYRGVLPWGELAFTTENGDLDALRQWIDRARRMKFNLVRVNVDADRATLPDESDDRLRAILQYARDRGMKVAVDVKRSADDGSPWFPLFRASSQEAVYRKCIEDGVESICVPGWDLSGVEHHVRYLADFAWNTDLTAEEFYRQYVAALFGESAVPAVSDLYRSYDELQIDALPMTPSNDRAMLPGAGWMASTEAAIPQTPEGFETEPWRTSVDRAGELLPRLTELLEKDQEAIDVLRGVMSKQESRNRGRTRLSINRLQFRVLCIRSVQAWSRALLSLERVYREKGLPEARLAASKDAELCVGLARQAVEKYAQEIHGRGDEEVVRRLKEEYIVSVEQFAAAIKPREQVEERSSDADDSEPQ